MSLCIFQFQDLLECFERDFQWLSRLVRTELSKQNKNLQQIKQLQKATETLKEKLNNQNAGIFNVYLKTLKQIIEIEVVNSPSESSGKENKNCLNDEVKTKLIELHQRQNVL